MVDERSKPPFNKRSPIPKDFDWQSLLKRDGDELETHYRQVLESLGKEKGMLGVIFRKAQNKIQDPAKLRRLIVNLIDKEQWSSLSADVKGALARRFAENCSNERTCTRSCVFRRASSTHRV
jgi:type I restriction enzyme M protein